MINFNVLIRDFWHYGGHMSELSRPGDYIKFTILGEDIILYNDGKSIIAFDNICPHRGAKFFSESRGNSMAVCKYHGWTIANGELHIPSRQNYPSCGIDFHQYNVDFCGSFVFFAVNPRSTLEDQLGAHLFELIEAISFDCSNLVDVNQYEYQCNALIAVENALEPDHVPFIHSETLQPLNLINCRNQFYGLNSKVEFDVGNVGISKGISRISKFYNLGSQAFDGYMSIHIFPFGFISSTGGYSYSIQNFFPSSEDRSNFISRLYFPDLNSVRSSVVSHLVDSVISVNKKVFDEDHEICKRISFKAWLRLIDGPLSIDEIKIKEFRKNIQTL